MSRTTQVAPTAVTASSRPLSETTNKTGDLEPKEHWRIASTHLVPCHSKSDRRLQLIRAHPLCCTANMHRAEGMMTCMDNPPVEKKVLTCDLAAPSPENAKLYHMPRAGGSFGFALRRLLSTLHSKGAGGAVSARVNTFFSTGMLVWYSRGGTMGNLLNT